MLVLDTTSKTITAVLSAAPATNQPNYVVAWADNNGTTFTEGASDGTLNGTSTVTMVASPAASTRRVIKSINIQNTDTAQVTVTVGYYNGTNTRVIAKVILNVGDTWTTDATFDPNGQLKYVFGSVNAATQLTGTVQIANGGTGQSTQQAALTALAGTQTSGQYLRSNGTNTLLSAIQAADVPILNQNTTGTAAGLSSTLAIASGGTGQTTASAAFNALSPITTTGDLIIGNGTNSATQLAIGANAYVLTSNGTTAFWAASSGIPGGSSTQVQFNNSGAFAGSSAITLTTTTATASALRIDPRVSSVTSASSVNPDVSAYDIYAFTSLATTLAINAPSGTPVNGDKLMFRFLDNGTSQTLNWNATYTVIGVILPTATTANKTTYVGCIYNAYGSSGTGRWDVIAVTTQL